MDDIVEAVERGMGNALARLGRKQGSVEETLLAVAAPLPLAVTDLAPIRNVTAEAAALDQAKATFAAERAQFAQEQYVARATAEVTRLITDRRVLPAENQPGPDGRPMLVAQFAQALADDAASPALFAPVGGTRFAGLCATYAARVPYAAVSADEGAAVHVLAAAGPEGESPADFAAKRKALLARTALGRAALKKES